ncbi:MAG: 4-hydroxythreonine-4-phosphate dehydrogenase PdxA, partial [Gluconacetobacter diazotrophicus]|nr:4-hydroxythreonine-4-phosphate dehydrogenase PdxA [Gluconacetobacter diazotrophicus]
ALTMGDPAGIGPEIARGAWERLRNTGGPRFVWLADPRLGGTAVGSVAEAAARFDTVLPVLPVPLAAAAVAGAPDERNAAAVTESIARAVTLAIDGAVGGVVTNPISKAVLRRGGFPHPGHTEFLAELTGQPGAEVMMLAGPELRVVPVTIHLSLREAIERLDTAEILRVARTTHAALRDRFGLARPRLAVAGLNPHAGEDGLMGRDEIELIIPAVRTLRAEGIDALGPLPPDTMFAPGMRERYDAAICMYHDQALIPLKTLDMARGVNITLGLDLVRTSPDHGTAFDIAGTGMADPTSLVEAIRMADRLARNTAGGRTR